MSDPVKSSEEYFNSSRLKVIGLITAATVAVGALGGIAGVAFDPEPIKQDNVVQPGGEVDFAPGNVDLGARAPAAPPAGASHVRAVPEATRRLPQALSTASPSPVSSASPSTGGFSSSPTPSTTQPPSPTPSQGGGSEGDTGVTLDATGAQVFVPAGWTQDFVDDNQTYLSDGQGSFAFAFSFADDPATAAGDVISANLEGLLPPENYTQRQTSDVVPLEAFGSLVSLAGIEYEALWVDNQGSSSIHGVIYVGVRQDGTVLGILLEHVPAEEFEDAVQEMLPILENSFGRFAGLG